jgi:hypothetical protein
MNQMNFKEDLEMLRRAGFTASAINRLCRLRREHAVNERDQAPADLHRLEFVRWLVMTGRLTDQVV